MPDQCISLVNATDMKLEFFLSIFNGVGIRHKTCARLLCRPVGPLWRPRTGSSRKQLNILSFSFSFQTLVKLNGGRHVQGILRGFDPFMNLVVDDCIEMSAGGQQNPVGMVVIRGNSIIMLEALERV
ncbi:hypothetical protein QTP70_014654 [Hemibagrus guttatus]|uniref:Small nuclear ribonucleoprotein G n=1 Tax=Hemibagrus guttatus TaxID=175788 RepID=A0AAE0QLC1_9TELE|nr:hypothetical protein QTP70_014654 [Hemibagrus guttatus]